MQVLKFGGSSVANAQNMAKVIDIVTNAVDRDRTILVSSAISGCTDTLIKIGTLASERDETYKGLIDDLQTRHHDIIDSFLEVAYALSESAHKFRNLLSAKQKKNDKGNDDYLTCTEVLENQECFHNSSVELPCKDNQ